MESDEDIRRVEAINGMDHTSDKENNVSFANVTSTSTTKKSLLGQGVPDKIQSLSEGVMSVFPREGDIFIVNGRFYEFRYMKGKSYLVNIGNERQDNIQVKTRSVFEVIHSAIKDRIVNITNTDINFYSLLGDIGRILFLLYVANCMNYYLIFIAITAVILAHTEIPAQLKNFLNRNCYSNSGIVHTVSESPILLFLKTFITYN